MNRFLLAVSALLLFSMTPAHGQAVAPSMVPAPSVPVVTPGFSPGTPAAPVYAPTGAGLPTVGQPGQPGAEVKRSDNKRVLPDEFDPKKQPGLWAADGATKATFQPPMTEPSLYGVVIPFPDHPTREERGVTWICASQMEAATKAVGADKYIDPAALEVRRCLAAAAYARCASELFKAFTHAVHEGMDIDPKMMAAHRSTDAFSRALEKRNCDGVKLPLEQKVALVNVFMRWGEKLPEPETEH